MIEMMKESLHRERGLFADSLSLSPSLSLPFSPEYFKLFFRESEERKKVMHVCVVERERERDGYKKRKFSSRGVKKAL